MIPKSMGGDVRVPRTAGLVKPVNTANTVTAVAPVVFVAAGALPGVATPPPQEITFTQMVPLLPQAALLRQRECML